MLNRYLNRLHFPAGFLALLTIALFTLIVACSGQNEEPTETSQERFNRISERLGVSQTVIPVSSNPADKEACELFEAALRILDEEYGDFVPFGMTMRQYYRVVQRNLELAHKLSRTADSEIRLGLTYLLDGIEYDDDGGTLANSRRVEKRCGDLGHPVVY
ncbi:MAG: hypothetical protein HQ477_11870 [Chloroflexi bacterium]|nr:hypothetical protein [Chloroflexota bacterium]